VWIFKCYSYLNAAIRWAVCVFQSGVFYFCWRHFWRYWRLHSLLHVCQQISLMQVSTQ